MNKSLGLFSLWRHQEEVEKVKSNESSGICDNDSWSLYAMITVRK